MITLRLRGAAMVVLAAGAAAHGLTIQTSFVAPGSLIPSIGTATSAPSTVVGGGDLESVVRAAADAWERLIPDQHTIKINFGWYDTSLTGNAGAHVSIATGGWPTRIVSSSIAFNSSENNDFDVFLDPTPTLNEEFKFGGRTFADLGAGPMEVSRRFFGVTEAARGTIDLYTTALHEIGHALGLTRWAPYLADTADGDIDIKLAPFAGASIPADGTHLQLPAALMSGTRWAGERRGITQTDLAAVCQTSSFKLCRLDLAPAEFAGDMNGDGAVNAADYTIVRDLQHAASRAIGSESPSSNVEIWSKNFGRTFQIAETFDGDYNGDGAVNAADYTLFRDAMATGNLTSDGNGDGKLTLEDWSYWSTRYGRQSNAAANAVPEPASGTLGCLLAWGGAFGRRRRR